MRGFTLIELLAVIVILAIILLIATPLITNLIDNAKRGAFESSAKLIVGAAEIDFFSSGNVVKTFSIVDAAFVGNSFDFSGKLPDNGQISVREDGKISVAFQEGKFCAKKDFDGEIVITNYVEGECTLSISQPTVCTFLNDSSPAELQDAVQFVLNMANQNRLNGDSYFFDYLDFNSITNIGNFTGSALNISYGFSGYYENSILDIRLEIEYHRNFNSSMLMYNIPEEKLNPELLLSTLNGKEVIYFRAAGSSTSPFGTNAYIISADSSLNYVCSLANWLVG